MFREIDTLNLLQKILSGKEQRSFGHVFTGEKHLGECDHILHCPFSLMHKLALELPTKSFGAIYILKPHPRHIHFEFSGTPCPECTVAAHLEIGNSLLRNNRLGEGDALALRFEIIGHHLVHAALLKIDLRRLGHYQIGIHLLLGLIEGICEYHKLCSRRYARQT